MPENASGFKKFGAFSLHADPTENTTLKSIV